MTKKLDEKIAAALDLAKIGFYSYLFDGTIVSIDQVSFDFFELDGIFKGPPSLIGKKIESLFVYTGPKGKLRKKIKEKGQVAGLEYGLKTLKGKEKWGVHNSYLLVDEKSGKEAVQACFYDITEQKQTQKKLAERENTLKAIFAASPVSIGLTQNQIIQWGNKKLYDMLDYEDGSLEGESVQKVYPDDDEFERTEKELYQGLKEKNLGQTETKWITSNGKTLNILLSASSMDTENPSKGVIISALDITDQKWLEAQIIQSQKIEAIGTLAGGIAHDFNNMLGVITGNTSYALYNLNNNDDLHEILLDIQEGAKQAQTLTQQLLTFSRGGAPIKTPLQLNPFIKSVAKLVLSGSAATCELNLSHDLWTAMADEGQLHQVFSNILINAAQAMPGGGTIQVSTENTYIETDRRLPLPPGPYIHITINDHGIGISEDHISKIFDPFFSTKQKGSGLGLATTYSIIKKHDGHICVESRLGGGSSFHIYLPITEQPASATEDKDKVPHEGKGKVLIMDDQDALLKMAARMVGLLGYEATLAKDGDEAIEIYREAYLSKKPFDLVILDLTVPGGMGGAKTIPELLKIDPQVKAIVSSGYANDPVMANYENYGFSGIIPKPYLRDQIAEVFNNIVGKKE